LCENLKFRIDSINLTGSNNTATTISDAIVWTAQPNQILCALSYDGSTASTTLDSSGIPNTNSNFVVIDNPVNPSNVLRNSGVDSIPASNCEWIVSPVSNTTNDFNICLKNSPSVCISAGFDPLGKVKLANLDNDFVGQIQQARWRFETPPTASSTPMVCSNSN